MRPFKKLAVVACVVGTTALTGPVFAQNISGPTQIVSATSTIPSGSSTYALPQIRDGNSSDAAPFNGFQGADGATGTITFMLNKAYDLTSFYLWNDINVRAEGVGSYSLQFFDASNALVGTAGPFTAAAGKTPANMNSFPAVANVKKVDLIVNSLQAQANSFAQRVEIREAAFGGTPSGKCVTAKNNGTAFNAYPGALNTTLNFNTITTITGTIYGQNLTTGLPEQRAINAATDWHNGGYAGGSFGTTGGWNSAFFYSGSANMAGGKDLIDIRFGSQDGISPNKTQGIKGTQPLYIVQRNRDMGRKADGMNLSGFDLTICGT